MSFVSLVVHLNCGFSPQSLHPHPIHLPHARPKHLHPRLPPRLLHHSPPRHRPAVRLDNHPALPRRPAEARRGNTRHKPQTLPLTLPTNAKVLTQPTYLSLGVFRREARYLLTLKERLRRASPNPTLGPGQAVEFNVTFTGGGTLYFCPGVNGTPTGNYNQDTARYSVGITCDKNGWSLAINGGVLTTVDDKPRWAFDKRRDVLTYWPALEKAQQNSSPKQSPR